MTVALAPSTDWLTTLSLRDIGLALGALVAALTLSVALWEWWRRTLGRRGELYRRIERLGVGAQLSFFEAVIGEPPAMKHSVEGTTYEESAHEEGEDWEPVEVPNTFTETLFVDRYYFLQTISDEGGTVEAFSVTTRHRRFRPVFTGFPRPTRRTERLRGWIRARGYPGYLFRVKLGRTTFSEIEEDPFYIRAWDIMRAGAYSEAHGGGAVTRYQTFVFTASTAAGVAPTGPLPEVASAVGFGSWSPGERRPDARMSPTEPCPENFDDIPKIREQRKAIITTYSVLAMPPDMYPDTTFGPHDHEVATLP